MDFTRALKYPFQNSPKVLSIVLTLTILISVCIVWIANGHDWSSYLQVADINETMDHMEDLESLSGSVALGFFGLLILMVLGGFWLNGYSVEVLRRIMNHSDTMPPVEIGANLSSGFWVFLSIVWYGFVSIFLAAALIVLIGILSNLASFLGGIAAVAGFFLGVVYVFVAGWAFFVGLTRYARSDGNRSALFDIRRNMRIARDNRGLSIRLSLYMIAFMILYGSAQSLVDNLLGGFLGQDIVVSAVVFVVTYHAFNLFQHFSSQHLIAQYGMAIAGDDMRKGKPDF